jgi:RND family efflux transporter MFP subunit
VNERLLKIVLPLVILLAGAAATAVIILSKPSAPTRPAEEYAPFVRVVEAVPETRRLAVRTQGTVRPRTETALVSEVLGRVLNVSSSFAAGGFFEKGDILVQVDPRDYELAVITAKGQVAQARVRAELEEAQSKVAQQEWEDLGTGEASPLATRELQLQEAMAGLATAEAAFERAERNLAKTTVRAPFVGRVREKLVDVGQFVSPGVPVATIFAVDYVEVRLPIPDAQLAYVDLPVTYRGEAERPDGPEVRLYADFAGKRREWTGRIVRVEGEIDPVSRMVHAIAQVDDPYGRVEGRDPAATLRASQWRHRSRRRQRKPPAVPPGRRAKARRFRGHHLRWSRAG